MNRPLTHNMLWTWDARMRWVPAQATAEKSAMAIPETSFPFPYDRAFFVDNYKEMIRTVSQWPEISHIIIWGLLRDSHGGVSAAQELVEFARDHGVAILAGVGSSGYGGVYYEGDHAFNALTFMRKNPHLVVNNRRVVQGKMIDRGATLNPVHPEVIHWVQEGVRWLLETLPVAGINFEIGDFFVGDNALAKQHRDRISGVRDEFFKALASHYRQIVPSLIREYPNRFFSFATYSDSNAEILQENQRFLEYLPEELACQWTLSDSVESDPANFGEESRIHFGYAHLFCEANKSDQRDLTRELAKACRTARKRGLQGVAIYGEQPADTEWGRLNYTAFRKFLRDPAAAESAAPVNGELLATTPG